jgi:hypothetical protein
MPSSVFSVHQPTFTRKLSVVDRLRECRPTEVDCTYMQLSSPRALFNRGNSTEVRQQPEYDSHRFPPTGATDRCVSRRPSSYNLFNLPGNDARLQLVTASSTTTKANGANKMICGTADHRSGKHRSVLSIAGSATMATATPISTTITNTATTAGSAAEHTTIEIDCRVCSDHHHGRQIAGTATTEPTTSTSDDCRVCSGRTNYSNDCRICSGTPQNKRLPPE